MSSNPQVTIGVTAVDKASGVLKSLDSQVMGTTSKIETSGAKAASVTEKSSASVVKSYAGIATSIASLGAGIVSFATSFSTLEKAQNRVDVANLTLERSQAKLEKMQQSGKATAEQLATAQEDVRVKTNMLNTTQGDLSDTYTNFLAQVPSQLISFGVAGSGIMKLLGISHGQAAAGATGQAGTVNLLSASLWRAVGAAVAARAAMIAAFIATPVGAVITGVSIVIIALATNVGGLRDRVFELGNAILNFLDHHFKPLADAIRWFIDNVAKPLGNFFGSAMPDNVQTAEGALDSFDNAVVSTGTGITTMVANAETAIPKISGLVDNATLRIQAMIAAFAAGQSVINASNIVHAGGSFRGAFGPGAPSPSRTVNLTNFANPAGGRQLSARVAQGGLNEMLAQDTVIFAHKGEHAQITPRSGGRQPFIIQLVTPDSRVIAEWLVNDMNEAISRKRTIHMRITHEAIHGTI